MRDYRQAGWVRAIVIVLIVIIVVIITLLWHGNQTANNRSNPSTTSSQSTNTSPDRVKAKNGPNADIKPSPTGTGPGSNNSLLGQ